MDIQTITGFFLAIGIVSGVAVVAGLAVFVSRLLKIVRG